MTLRGVNVLYVSIDACRPEFIMEPEKFGLKLPNLAEHFIKNSTYASKGIVGVFPTATYPCHATMMTGVSPEKHGVHNNTYFDPEGKYLGAWYWYREEKDIPTLWDLAGRNGYLTANVCWSTSIGARIDYDIPQVWFTFTELDVKFIDACSRPQGIVLEMEKDIGEYRGSSWDIDGDSSRTKAAIWLLEKKIKPQLAERPFFMTVYYASYDELAHKYGTFSPKAKKALEEIDSLVGELVGKAQELTGNNMVVCIASDHGMMDNVCEARPNTEFYKAGLIKLDEKGKLLDWDVYMQRAGGTCIIRLKNPEDKAVRSKVESILERLATDPAKGISRLLTKEQCIKELNGYSKADYVLIGKAGYEFREDMQGEYLNYDLTNVAQHGYTEHHPEMRSIWLIQGPNIKQNHDLGEGKLLDLAPSLAKIMGFEIPGAEGKSLV